MKTNRSKTLFGSQRNEYRCDFGNVTSNDRKGMKGFL